MEGWRGRRLASGRRRPVGGDEGENLEWEEDEEINWEKVTIASKPDEKDLVWEVVDEIKWPG